jgi:hypothetical protein
VEWLSAVLVTGCALTGLQTWSFEVRRKVPQGAEPRNFWLTFRSHAPVDDTFWSPLNQAMQLQIADCVSVQMLYPAFMLFPQY